MASTNQPKTLAQLIGRDFIDELGANQGTNDCYRGKDQDDGPINTHRTQMPR